MKLSVQLVPIQFVHQTWPLVKDYILAALEEGDLGEPMYNIEHVKGYVTSGSWALLVAVDESNNIHGAATISFINQPLHRVAFITAVGGRLISSKDTYAQLQNIARQNGATILQGYGRPTIVRLWKRYNFESRNTLVEAIL